MSNLPEPWLRGPVAGICATLQPAAHAFIMAREDVTAAVTDLSVDQLWARPGGAGSIGFHLAHLVGATGRLLTYARGESLSADQKAYIGYEKDIATIKPSVVELVAKWHAAVDAALAQLSATPESSLLDARAVGKAQLPTTVLGAIFHAAEHASRHTGQIVTTAKVVRGA